MIFQFYKLELTFSLFEIDAELNQAEQWLEMKRKRWLWLLPIPILIGFYLGFKVVHILVKPPPPDFWVESIHFIMTSAKVDQEDGVLIESVDAGWQHYEYRPQQNTGPTSTPLLALVVDRPKRHWKMEDFDELAKVVGGSILTDASIFGFFTSYSSYLAEAENVRWYWPIVAITSSVVLGGSISYWLFHDDKIDMNDKEFQKEMMKPDGWKLLAVTYSVCRKDKPSHLSDLIKEEKDEKKLAKLKAIERVCQRIFSS